MLREKKGDRHEHEERTFALTVGDTPGLLSRVDALFRRQRVPLRTVFFEKEEGASDRARLTLVTEASAEQFSLLSRQLLRLRDVHHVGAAMSAAAAVPSFTLEEKTA
jgi:acetolactate synthase small subunit